jgi:hypothetical protein
MRVAIWFYEGIKNNLLGLMVLDKLSIVSGNFFQFRKVPKVEMNKEMTFSLRALYGNMISENYKKNHLLEFFSI